MRYYVFHAIVNKIETTIVCERYKTCPLVPNHILCIGVLHLKETIMEGLDVDCISIEKSKINYYTVCLKNEIEENSEEDTNG